MIHIARHMYHLSGKSAVLRGHLKAIAALKQVFAGDHIAIFGDKEAGTPIRGRKRQRCRALPQGQCGRGQVHPIFLRSCNGLSKVNLFPREHSIHQFQTLLGGGLVLFRRQGPPGTSLHRIITAQGREDGVGHIDLCRQHGFENGYNQLDVFIGDKQIKCSQGFLGLSGPIQGRCQFQDRMALGIQSHHVINQARMFGHKGFGDLLADQCTGSPSLVIKQAHIVLTGRMAHACSLTVQKKCAR